MVRAAKELCEPASLTGVPGWERLCGNPSALGCLLRPREAEEKLQLGDLGRVLECWCMAASLLHTPKAGCCPFLAYCTLQGRNLKRNTIGVNVKF